MLVGQGLRGLATKGGQGGCAPSASHHTACTTQGDGGHTWHDDNPADSLMQPAKSDDPDSCEVAAAKTRDSKSDTSGAIAQVLALNAALMSACLAPACAFLALTCTCPAVPVCLARPPGRLTQALASSAMDQKQARFVCGELSSRIVLLYQGGLVCTSMS